MSNQAWMYKGKESKIFNEDELKQAESEGWFDNPTDATKAEVEIQAKKEADRLAKEESDRKAKEEAEFEAELKKEETAKTGAAASGATTLEKNE